MLQPITVLNSDTSTFKNLFDNKLVTLLSPDEIGAFILVLANSLQDKKLHHFLSEKIEKTFEEIKNRPTINAAPDDLFIWNILKETGILQYQPWQHRAIDHWLCTYNPFRGLRPERSSKEAFNGLKQEFNHDKFHFSKPFLRSEIISEEQFENTKLQIMYQKFPFVPYHLLIVLNAAQHLPQYLNQEAHLLIWNLAAYMRKNIQGFSLAYNSLGAGASVNQLHIHGCIIENTLAIENNHWKHNGGNQEYPLNPTCFTSAKESWGKIKQHHQNNQPYNLLYSQGLCYVIPRKPHRSTTPTSNCFSSIAWHEACGGLSLGNISDYNKLAADDIYTHLNEYRI